MKIINIFLTLFFGLLLMDLIYIKIFNNMYVNEILSRVVLILLLILVFNKKTKITWYTGLILFFYGLLDIYYLNIESAEPAISNFISLYFNIFFEGQFDFALRIIPAFFYVFSIIYFLSNPIKRIYLK